MRASGLILVSIIVAMSCSADDGGATAEPTRSREAPAQPAALAPSGCPVQDEAFCRTAVDVATPFSGGEGDSLLSLAGRPGSDCAEIALWYLDTLERWETEQTDPMTQSFCEAGLHPWLA